MRYSRECVPLESPSATAPTIEASRLFAHHTCPWRFTLIPVLHCLKNVTFNTLAFRAKSIGGLPILLVNHHEARRVRCYVCFESRESRQHIAIVHEPRRDRHVPIRHNRAARRNRKNLYLRSGSIVEGSLTLQTIRNERVIVVSRGRGNEH